MLRRRACLDHQPRLALGAGTGSPHVIGARTPRGAAHGGKWMQLRFLTLMISLTVVDLAITGIFIAVSGRFSVLTSDLLANVALLGALNFAGAWLLFRPIGAFLSARRNPSAARARIEALPWLATSWAVVCTIGYCITAFSIGVFVPEVANAEPVPDGRLIAGLIWFGFLYALYYGFYIYFAISDFTHDLKSHLFGAGLAFRPARTRIVHKLLVVFVVAAFVPSVLIALDLSVFRALRAAQGLTVEQTILLDLLASAFLITVSLVFVTRSLVRPINVLMTAMQRLRGGQLEVRTPVMSSDELGVLAARFNEMAEGLREREFIRETFGRYVPTEVAATLVAQQGILKPQLRTATILFADLEDFTRIAERQSPETVLRMLNEYFSAASEPIRRAGGVVDYFQGDAMLVTFNVPVADPQHADHAVTAAIELQRVIARRTFAGVPLRARVGINTGEVIAGAVGSDDRLSYTVYGDAVNLAARLERLNKERDTRVLVSGSTVAQLTGSYPLEPMGEIAIRGKANLVSVYNLVV